MSRTPAEQHGRPMPQSLEAERAVLGGAMLDGSQVHDLAELVAPADFYRPAHGRLWSLILEMSRAHKPVELVALVEEVIGTSAGSADPFDAYGGLAYVTSLSDEVPSTTNLRYYAQLVREAGARRKMIALAGDIETRARDGSVELPELLGYVSSAVGQWQASAPSEWTPIGALMPGALDALADVVHARAAGKQAGSVRTGIKALDEALTMLGPGKVCVIAGRPGSGKTALACGIADHVAETRGTAAIFSLEMPGQEIAQRVLFMRSRVNGERAQKGLLVRAEWMRLHQAGESIASLPLYIDSTNGLTLAQAEARLRRLQAARPDLTLAVFDYLGLMGGERRNGEEALIARNSAGLKALAKELGICVLVLAQLNRDCEKRDDKRPRLSDLRGSGSIEQDADILVLIYRDEYYNPESAARGIAELNIAKQRGGPASVKPVLVGFEGETTRFHDLGSP